MMTWHTITLHQTDSRRETQSQVNMHCIKYMVVVLHKITSKETFLHSEIMKLWVEHLTLKSMSMVILLPKSQPT